MMIMYLHIVLENNKIFKTIYCSMNLKLNLKYKIYKLVFLIHYKKIIPKLIDSNTNK